MLYLFAFSAQNVWLQFSDIETTCLCLCRHSNQYSIGEVERKENPFFEWKQINCNSCLLFHFFAIVSMFKFCTIALLATNSICLAFNFGFIMDGFFYLELLVFVFWEFSFGLFHSARNSSCQLTYNFLRSIQKIENIMNAEHCKFNIYKLELCCSACLVTLKLIS